MKHELIMSISGNEIAPPLDILRVFGFSQDKMLSPVGLGLQQKYYII